jgi:5'-nucleotidase
MEESTLQNRRDFLKKVGLGSIGIIGLSSFGVSGLNELLKEDFVKLTVLHTNDMHSRVESFPQNHKKYPGQGGMVNVGKTIQEVRGEQGEILLLDAGDIFQGTPYFNEFGGELEFKIMSKLKYDCATMGNHDFDNGLEGFNKMLPHANFPFVTANYNFEDTLLKGKTKPYKIIYKKGLKIGVFGVGVELEGLVSKTNYGNTQYLDPIENANLYANILRNEEKCNLVVCLSHLGYEYKNTKICDKDLAKQTANIDLIIGGHTHTFLEKAETFINKNGKKVLVNQAGWSALSLGRVDFVFSRKEGKLVDTEEAGLGIVNYTAF